MITIRQEDMIGSVADALQIISYTHPGDHLRALGDAWQREQSPAARDAITQILANSRMCFEGKRPICQDTGIVVAFLKIGMNVRWDAQLSVEDMINAGVRRAYTHPDNPLRASIVADPAGMRCNTQDNTPAVVHLTLVPGDTLEVILAAKGGGSENKARLAMLNPTDNLVDWVLDTIPSLGAGWCPPGIIGLGIGGTAEKAMLLAKESLLAPVNIQALQARGPTTRLEELRLEIYDKVNALGIGAQGLGGLTTVLDVKILDYPTHAASLPVALIPNCAATRHIHFTLNGSGPATLPAPKLEDWPPVTWSGNLTARHVNLDTLQRDDVAAWRSGETLLLSGTLLTGRDAAHRRIADLIANDEPLPAGVDFTNRLIYYVGPVSPVRSEVVGPAGPTTATRMDKFTDLMLRKTGLIGMIGKAERGPEAIASIKRHRAAYLVAVGGAAYLVAKAIKSAKVIAFEELGMEAIYAFQVEDMPVTVAVDVHGNSIHTMGPLAWQQRTGTIPVVTQP